MKCKIELISNVVKQKLYGAFKSWIWYRAIRKWLLFPVLKFWQDFALGYRKVPHLNTVNKCVFWCLYLLHGGLKCNKYLCCACVQGWVKHNHEETWCFCKFTTQTLWNTWSNQEHNDEKFYENENYSQIYTAKQLFFYCGGKRECFLLT